MCVVKGGGHVADGDCIIYVRPLLFGLYVGIILVVFS